jgi:ubiquitin-protein ligase
LLTKRELAFGFHMTSPNNPYSGLMIRGVIKIDTSYPHSPPYIWFKPNFPHINVYATGMHCTFAKWKGNE